MYLALRVVMKYKCISFIDIGMGWGQILTLKNDPTSISAPRVFI